MGLIHIDDGLYEATLDEKRVFFAVGAIARGNGAEGTRTEIERLLQLLQIKAQLPDHWSLSVLAPTNGLRMKAEFGQAVREAPDGCIVAIICKNDALQRLALRLVEGHAAPK